MINQPSETDVGLSPASFDKTRSVTQAVVAPPALRRSIGLPLAVLYGLGVTVGAGIYVLVGTVAGRAGPHGPIAFAIGAAIMALTACCFAELVGRAPVSAGEAAYVRLGFRSERLALIVGLLVVAAGIIAAAAITLGSVGYLRLLVGLPPGTLAVLVLMVMGAIAAVGISESAWTAAIMTLIEIAGLVAIVVIGITLEPQRVLDLSPVVHGLGQSTAWSGIFAATLLSVFAFIGFEGLANIAEEVHEPEKTLPRAIFLTLIISTILYMLVYWVSVRSIPASELAGSPAPLSLVFERVTGAPPHVVTVIAIIATLNGIIAQIVMASRVMYGLASQGKLPAILARVHWRTRTPLLATSIAVVLSILLVLAFPIDRLADMTSRVILVIFGLVNASLYLIKRRGETAPVGTFIAPAWVPPAGIAACVLALLADFA